jgi:hypothetical protein
MRVRFGMKSRGKKPLGTPRHTWKVIKMDLKDIR